MSDIDLTEAVEAAHRAECSVPGCSSTSSAERGVRAALPHIERQIREQERARLVRFANALEEYGNDLARLGLPNVSTVGRALAGSARVARGDSS